MSSKITKYQNKRYLAYILSSHNELLYKAIDYELQRLWNIAYELQLKNLAKKISEVVLN